MNTVYTRYLVHLQWKLMKQISKNLVACNILSFVAWFELVTVLRPSGHISEMRLHRPSQLHWYSLTSKLNSWTMKAPETQNLASCDKSYEQLFSASLFCTRLPCKLQSFGFLQPSLHAVPCCDLKGVLYFTFLSDKIICIGITVLAFCTGTKQSSYQYLYKFTSTLYVHLQMTMQLANTKI